MSWLGRLFNRGRTDPPDPRSSSSYSANSGASGGAGGGVWPLQLVPPDLRLTTDEMASTSTVWAAMRAIVDPIASSEIRVVTRDASGGRKHLVDDEIGYLLNVRPGTDFTAQAFKEIILSQTVIHGDGFAEIVRDGAGKVRELWPLQSEYMYLMRDYQTNDLIYRYRQPGNEGEIAYLNARDVLHIRGPSVLGLTGDSLIYRAAKAIALHVAQEKFATAYFSNGTVLGGFIKVPMGLSQAARDKYRSDFKRLFGGHKRAHGMAFLEAGMEYQAIGSNAGESQLVPSRAFSVEEIARYFSVPLVRLGVQAAAQGYGTNVNQLNLQFVRDSLTPWVNRFCEEGTYKLFPQKAPWRTLEIDTTWLTQGDDEQRARANQIAIQSGVKTINEVRASEGLNGIGDDGDLYLVPNNLVVLDEENLTKPDPAPPPAPPAPPEEPEEAEEEEGPEAAAEAKVRVALDRHARRVRARRADLERAGKTPEEIAANIATTLRAKALAEIDAAIAEAGATISVAGGYAEPVTTSTENPVTE